MREALAALASRKTSPALVDAAIQYIDGDGRGGRDDDVRSSPAVQAIVTAPDHVRRQCILIAARQQHWAAARLLSYIARKRAGLTLRTSRRSCPRPSAGETTTTPG